MRGAMTIRSPLETHGDPSDEDDEVLLRMWGRDYMEIDPRSPLHLVSYAGSQSYGMNALTGEANWKPGQIMLLDAMKVVVDLDGTTKDIDSYRDSVAGRHRGNYVNVVDTGGAAWRIHYDELEEDVQQPDGAWRRQADARAN